MLTDTSEIQLAPELLKYFWGDDLQQLSWKRNSTYITQTLLEKGDTDAVHWLFSKVERKKVLSLLPDLRLSPKSANFWLLYLAE